MERGSQETKIIRKSRIGTYFLMSLVALALMAISAIVIEYFEIKRQNENLQKIKYELLIENEILKSEVEKLDDEDYFSIYVKEHYFYNGKIIYK